jgi:hypothetical protein
MLQALLQGKLSREQENLEDLLTSGVFGLLAYLPPQDGLLPLLRLATDDDGTPLSAFDVAGWRLKDEVSFWPTQATDFAGATEPDVLIRATDDAGENYVISIEVKLWSEKSLASKSTIRDQLAREWYSLVSYCKNPAATPLLIYITSHLERPVLDIKEGRDDYSKHCQDLETRFPFRCAWLSWSKVAMAFSLSANRPLRDIAMTCRRLDLGTFDGISTLHEYPVDWCFQVEPYNFATINTVVSWRWR